jgi:hypothetical protein
MAARKSQISIPNIRHMGRVLSPDRPYWRSDAFLGEGAAIGTQFEFSDGRPRDSRRPWQPTLV